MLNAIADRIIVKLDSRDESVILLPEEQQSAANRGVVQSIGSLVKAIKCGDHVVFHPYDEITLPEKDLVVIREKSVLATYDDNK